MPEAPQFVMGGVREERQGLHRERRVLGGGGEEAAELLHPRGDGGGVEEPGVELALEVEAGGGTLGVHEQLEVLGDARDRAERDHTWPSNTAGANYTCALRTSLVPYLADNQVYGVRDTSRRVVTTVPNPGPGLNGSSKPVPLSDAPEPSPAGRFNLVVGLLLTAVCGCVAFVFVGLPLWRAVEAWGWVEVPCRILESRVAEDRSSDGTVYRVEVRFAYDFPPVGPSSGREPAAAVAQAHESTRYDLSGGMYSSGQGPKALEVADLPPGRVTTCTVDPDDPSEAVLRAGLPSGFWFGSLTLVFVAAGVAMILTGLRERRRARALRRAPPTAGEAARPVELARALDYGEIVVIGAFAVCLNVAAWSMFISELRASWILGKSISLTSLVFPLFGLLPIWFFSGHLRRLLNPRLRMTVNRSTLRPGETLELQWVCVGDPTRLSALQLAVEGRESATYTRGTEITSDTSVFARYRLVALKTSAKIARGQTTFVVPTGTIASFVAPHNRLEWFVTVRAGGRWSDVEDDYPITVLPSGDDL